MKDNPRLLRAIGAGIKANSRRARPGTVAPPEFDPHERPRIKTHIRQAWEALPPDYRCQWCDRRTWDSLNQAIMAWWAKEQRVLRMENQPTLGPSEPAIVVNKGEMVKSNLPDGMEIGRPAWGYAAPAQGQPPASTEPGAGR